MDSEAITSFDVLERMLHDEDVKPIQLSLSLLKDITNRFSDNNKIGSGGFAVVYKGMVGTEMVAVKKLTNTFIIHENKFHEELKCLIKAKHKNIVRFLGYCVETRGTMEDYDGVPVVADQRNWLLCFEFARNGSLDSHITDASCGLRWSERFRIIKGICDGLFFLHEKRILHLDLKPANILVDHHMVPKIADFGLSRNLGEEQSRAITNNICGTMGYVDPEYLKTGQITFASDIYSLGVIIMEILSGVKGYLEAEDVVESWMNQFKALEGDMRLEQVRVCTQIGIECMDFDPKKRPAVRDIIDRLDRMTNANYSDEVCINNSLVESQASSPREQSREGIGKLATESSQKDLVEEHSDILEDVPEHLAASVDFPEVQETKQKVNSHGASISSSISAMFYKLNNLEIFNRKARRSGGMQTLEKSHNVKMFREKELNRIIRSGKLIGQGVFTEVYKGILDNALVAVKKPIRGSMLENEQIENQIIILSQVSHKNIVRLIGCCLEVDTPMAVYEFISNGTLNGILHNYPRGLDLDVRLVIVAELAQGLAYLHSQARTKILHHNVKPANILLDENFMPKIAGFGISRLMEEDNEYTKHVIADLSYSDPIYLEKGLLTQKSDVYSFGIVVLEVISRKRASHSDNHSLVRSFVEVHEKGKKATDLFDKEIAVTKGDLEILDSLAEIAVECLMPDVDQRPMMTDVAERLVILKRSRRSQVV